MKKFLLKTVLGMHESLRAIHMRSLEIMATLDDVKTSVQAIRDAAAAEKAQVQEKLDSLSAQIADLAAKLEEGVTPEELDAVVADLNTAAADISNIFTPDAQAEEPTPEAPADDIPNFEQPAPEETPEAPLDGEPQPLLP